jgi:two-component system phosphate regulon response regulator PhoB
MSDDAPRILVVDDEPPLRELVVVTLGDAYHCDEARDGDEALALLREHPYDLVLLDVMLPGRSGLDVLREIRSDDRLRDVPVVVISAWQQESDVDAAREAGGSAFLPKPFPIDDLVAAVDSLLPRAA